MRRDDSGASQVLSLLTTGILFLGTVAVLLVATSQTGSDAGPGQANAGVERDRDVDALASLIAGSAGLGWAGGADAVSRLGLATSNGTIDPNHLAALSGASNTQSLANGRIDYPDARTGLGLATGEEFHLQLRVNSELSASSVPLSGVRTAYIGDWTSLGSVTVSTGTQDAVTLAANVALNTSMGANTATERQMLHDLGLSFNDRVYMSTTGPTVMVDLPTPLPDTPILTYLSLPLIEGGVYPDNKQYIDANLPARLANYDLLVIGSGVDQSVLTGNAVKNGIATWVNAGGRLMVMGSDAQNYQWLQPMFAANTASVSGPITPASPFPAALAIPYALDWSTYDSHGLAWDVKASGNGAHYNDFDHLVTQGGYDVLAISHKGGFGTGYIVLSSWRPRELPQTEASHLITNLINYKGSVLVQDIDYGPSVPTNVPVSASQRTTQAWDPVLGLMTVDITVYTWTT